MSHSLRIFETYVASWTSLRADIARFFDGFFLACLVFCALYLVWVYIIKPPRKKPKRKLPQEWFRTFATVGDPFPPTRAIRALHRPLNTLTDESPNQYVALAWLDEGYPVLGRVWNKDGKIAASFAHDGCEWTNGLGTIELLFELPEQLRKLDYAWVPYADVISGEYKHWHPVYVDVNPSVHRFLAPAVISFNNKEILGQINIRTGIASFGYKGWEYLIKKELALQSKVLCRATRRPVPA